MSKISIETLAESEIFNKYAKIFIEKNSKVNLISKNDEKFLVEKHIFDSLAITEFLDKQVAFFKPPRPNGERDGVRGDSLKKPTLLDIGTGGGFPAVPIAIYYEGLEVYALDSIRKKVKAIEEIKDELGLKNLHPICERAEKIEQQFDYVTSRAVSNLDTILKYAVPKLKDKGYFIAYKSKKAQDEIEEAKKTIKRLGVKIVDILEYNLPLDENFERNLIIFKKI